jgi:hypothetical protein
MRNLDTILADPSFTAFLGFIGFEYIVTCTPIVRQRVGKQVLAKTDSW